LVKLVLVTSTGADAGVEIRRDGVRVPPSLLGVEVPVDPGAYRVEAEAPGRVAWSTRVSATEEGRVVSITIPALPPVTQEPAQEAPVPPPPPVLPVRTETLGRTTTAPEGRRPTTLTWVALGVGVTGVAVGSYFGVAALSAWKQAKPGCDAAHVCADPAAYDEAARARRYGDVASVAFVVGGVALATSAVLYFTTPRDRAVHVRPAISTRSAGLALEGGF
jgi:hypothetical protein